MGWSMYTARFGTTKPAFLPAVEHPEAAAAIVRRGLDWMFPEVSITADSALVRLSMNAPSAEAALAHLRGSYRSALYTAGIWQVGNWPLHLISVEAGLPEDVVGALGAVRDQDSLEPIS